MNSSAADDKNGLRHPLGIFSVLSQVDRRWWRGYLYFLAKMLAKYPLTWSAKFIRWNRYLFAAGSTHSPLPPPPLLRCEQVERAVEAFHRYGFVVLSDAMSAEDAERLRHAVEQKADELVEQHRKGLLQVNTVRGKLRYSFDDVGHCEEWEDLGLNPKVLPIVKAIWAGRTFRAVSAGGDFVLPGGIAQPLHSDEGWRTAGERVPDMITLNCYVSHVLPHCGPLRQIPGTVRFPLPHSMVSRIEADWMKQAIITGPPGTVILRDSRGWHGGTPNTSQETRYMPNMVYVLRDAPSHRLGSAIAAARLDQGRWIAEFEQ